MYANEIYRDDGNGFNADDSTLPCENCGKADVHVRFGGHKNLGIHQASKSCKTQALKNAKPKVKFSSLRTFGSKVPKKNPSTVSSPPIVHAPPLSELSAILEVKSALLSPNLLRKDYTGALELLDKLENNARRIPERIPLAGDDHPLAVFAGDPSLCVKIGANCWEVVNPMMKGSIWVGT